MPDFTFTFKGVASNTKGITVVNVKRPIMPPIKLRTLDIPSMPGAYYGGYDIGLLQIPVDIELNSATIQADKRALTTWLGPQETLSELIFSDEPDLTYKASVSGNTDFQQLLTYGKGTINFLCTDPFAYSAQKTRSAEATFSRASTAYKKDGTPVAAGVPRFEAAKFADGIMVETGATNLLSANQSSVETDLTGLRGYSTNASHTFVQDTATARTGASSAKITSTYATAQNIEIDTDVAGGHTAISASTTYIFSVYLKASAASGRQWQLKISWWDASGVLISTDSSALSNASGIWSRPILVVTSPANAAAMSVAAILVDALTNEALWWDSAQIEPGYNPTSFTLGGSTRSPEMLTIPTQFNPGNWSVEFWYVPYAIPFLGYAPIRELFNLRIDANNYYRIFLAADSRVVLEVKSGGTIYSTYTATEPPLSTNGIYHIAATGDGAALNLYQNGSPIGAQNKSYVEPAGNLPASIYLGSDTAGGYQANGVIDELRISNAARSASAIASQYASSLPANADESTLIYMPYDDSFETASWVEGSAQSYPVITATITAAASELKILHYESGKYLRIVKSLAAGDVLIFDCEKSFVKLNGVYIMNYLDLASDFFPLQTGANTLIVTPNNTCTLSIAYNPRWL